MLNRRRTGPSQRMFTALPMSSSGQAIHRFGANRPKPQAGTERARRSPEASHTSRGPAPRAGRRASRRRKRPHSLRSEAARRGNCRWRQVEPEAEHHHIGSPQREAVAAQRARRRGEGKQPERWLSGEDRKDGPSGACSETRASAGRERRAQDRRERHPASAHDHEGRAPAEPSAS